MSLRIGSIRSQSPHSDKVEKMNKTLIILSLTLLASCGPSAEEKKNIAAVTCSIMYETRNMDGAARVEKMNDARKEIGGEPYLQGDGLIKLAIEQGLCQVLVLGIYAEALDSRRERARIALEEESKRLEHKARVDAGEEDGLFEWYYESGQLASKVNWKDGKEDGLFEW